MLESLSENVNSRVEQLTSNVDWKKSNHASKFNVKIFSGRNLPPELVSLRENIYGNEKGYFPVEHVFDDNDLNGEHLAVYDENGKLIGAKFMIDAEKSDFSHHSGVPAERLSHCFLSGRGLVVPEYRNSGLFSFMLNLSLRYYQEKGRTHLLTYCEHGEIPAKKILNYKLIPGAKPRRVEGANGREYTVYPFQCRIDAALIRSFSKLNPVMKEHLFVNVYPQEIVNEVKKLATVFYKTSFFKAVESHTLSQPQYAHCLGNLHQFVRWTTRILGAATSICENPDLRKHFVHHLAGEVNHEQWLEEDLAHIGEDVSFVVNDMVANIGTFNFMFAQESLATWHRDPVIFMGVPIAIEGISALMSQIFIDDLRACVSSWGIKEPSKATKFLASHIHTDGADEGHWVGTIRMLQEYVKEEKEFQKISRIINLVFEAMTTSFNDFVSSPDLSVLPNLNPVRPEFMGASRA